MSWTLLDNNRAYFQTSLFGKAELTVFVDYENNNHTITITKRSFSLRKFENGHSVSDVEFDNCHFFALTPSAAHVMCTRWAKKYKITWMKRDTDYIIKELSTKYFQDIIESARFHFQRLEDKKLFDENKEKFKAEFKALIDKYGFRLNGSVACSEWGNEADATLSISDSKYPGYCEFDEDILYIDKDNKIQLCQKVQTSTDLFTYYNCKINNFGGLYAIY